MMLTILGIIAGVLIVIILVTAALKIHISRLIFLYMQSLMLILLP